MVQCRPLSGRRLLVMSGGVCVCVGGGGGGDDMQRKLKEVTEKLYCIVCYLSRTDILGELQHAAHIHFTLVTGFDLHNRHSK